MSRTPAFLESSDAVLDNPIWYALATRQGHLAIGDDRARRYPADVAPFIAVEDASPANVAALGGLAEPGETLFLSGAIPRPLTGWSIASDFLVSQLVYDPRADRPTEAGGISVLTGGDVSAMLELIALVYPGYFRSRTIEMGTYLGIRDEGRLVGMGGQRMCLDGYREISGVCTHPEFRGRGHAGRLVSHLVKLILAEGLIPFLHVDADNAVARSAYEKAGFAWRRDLEFHKIRRKAES